MPLQLYDKEQILDVCVGVFAQYGYEKTSTVMLAEAAGISRSLIFHHFKSKKELYLSLLERCFEKAKGIINVKTQLENLDFFEAREKVSIIKFEFNKKNPEIYKVLKEAALTIPDELREEIEQKYGAFITEKDSLWERLFEKVPLREGVDRRQAFELIMLTMDYFDKKYTLVLTDVSKWDENYVQSYLKERNSFLAMIRYGIEK